jgi:hypothetical protein
VLGNVEIVGAFKFENKIYLCVSRLLSERMFTRCGKRVLDTCFALLCSPDERYSIVFTDSIRPVESRYS